MSTKTPTIARIWRGRTTRAKADEYAKYLYETGIKPLEQKALAVQQLREDRIISREGKLHNLTPGQASACTAP